MFSSKREASCLPLRMCGIEGGINDSPSTVREDRPTQLRRMALSSPFLVSGSPCSKLSLQASEHVCEQADGQQRPMGCTLTGVIWHYGKTYLVNAGDSRTYRFRGGILRQLTTDETERGITGDPDASKLLLNCIGGGCEGYLRISSLDGKLLPGDILLVCSDGLSDMVSDDAIEEALANGATAEDLFKMACEGGGVDNISIILASIN